ncbi:MAG: precorrin-6Y C5,15-methyltransferase (decarboxylating) subunit CbiT [Atribacterota bacterium]
MTKEEIRVVVLSKLRLREDLTLWDVGAGTGTIAIEAARLLSRGVVFAIEKNEVAMRLIKENALLFGVENVIPVWGEAPEVLDTLPDPDRVFVGGSGGRLRAILKVVDKRLKEDGVIVVSGVTLETVTEAVSVLEDQNFSCAVVLLQYAFGELLGGKHLLRAANPVYVIQGERKHS